jgi:hypothetical protein
MKEITAAVSRLAFFEKNDPLQAQKYFNTVLYAAADQKVFNGVDEARFGQTAYQNALSQATTLCELATQERKQQEQDSENTPSPDLGRRKSF